MIKANMGTVETKGFVDEVMADYSCITLNLNKVLIKQGFSEEEAKEQLQKNFDMAFKDIETLKDECMKKMLFRLEDIMKLLKGEEDNE